MNIADAMSSSHIMFITMVTWHVIVCMCYYWIIVNHRCTSGKLSSTLTQLLPPIPIWVIQLACLGVCLFPVSRTNQWTSKTTSWQWLTAKNKGWHVLLFSHLPLISRRRFTRKMIYDNWPTVIYIRMVSSTVYSRILTTGERYHFEINTGL